LSGVILELEIGNKIYLVSSIKLENNIKKIEKPKRVKKLQNKSLIKLSVIPKQVNSIKLIYD